jgi:hypothetical protein
VFKYYIDRISISLDIFGNVACGEFLEDCITSEENTLFMDQKTTISASVGELDYHKKLNKTGVLLSRVLSKVFEKNHSINAYLKKMWIDQFNRKNNITFE